MPVTAVSPVERDQPESHWPLAVCAVAGATFLATAIDISAGAYSLEALAALTAALVAATLAVALGRGTASRIDVLAAIPVRRWVLALVGLALVHQFQVLLSTPDDAYFAVPEPQLEPFLRAALVVAGLASLATLVTSGRGRVACFALAVLIFFGIGVAVVASGPNTQLDVWMFQHEGSLGLLQGQNPYALSYPDLYPGTAFYGPGLVRDGVLTFGFPYPPLGLLLVLPAQALTGDFRYADVVALAMAAVLFAFAVRDAIGPPAALLFLFTPPVVLVLRQGWTEPLVVLAFAILVFAIARAPRWLAVALGAVLAVKQYGLLLLPLIWRHLGAPPGNGRARVRAVAGGLIVAAIVTVPFAIWDLDAFMRSVVALQLQQPFREDALSYLVPLTGPDGVPPLWLLPIAVGLAYLLALTRAPRTVAGLTAGAALVFLVFFAFNKQAFANYYFLVIALLAGAAAVTRLPGSILPGREASR